MLLRYRAGMAPSHIHTCFIHLDFVDVDYLDLYYCCRPGRWLGKAFRAGSSEGYNLFSASRAPPSSESSNAEGLPDGTLRERRFWCSTFSESVFDRGESSELNYGGQNDNGLIFGGMRDEVNKQRKAFWDIKQTRTIFCCCLFLSREHRASQSM